MKYLSVREIAALWNTSERSVRNYCAAGRVPGAFLTGKTWNIPENANHFHCIDEANFAGCFTAASTDSPS